MAAQRSPRQLIRKVEARETFPLIALAALRNLRVLLDDAEADAILRARELGATAEDIALALGITRQGAYYKIKRLERLGRSKDTTGGEVEDLTVTLPEPADTRSKDD